jgi:long-chain acyl-CoA synthetase
MPITQWAAEKPDKPAVIMAGSGEIVTYGALDARSNQGAHLFRKLGLSAGHHVALLIDNQPLFFEVCWAARRSGLIYTPISTHMSAADTAYILKNSDARVFVASSSLASLAAEAVKAVPALTHKFMSGDAEEGFLSWEMAIGTEPSIPVVNSSDGIEMCYSSGTTGRPKGVFKAPRPFPFGHPKANMVPGFPGFGFSNETRFLLPNPAYHSAPMNMSMIVHMLGGTVVLMERFSAENALKAIEQYRVNHGLFVPTMFVRMLALSDEVRAQYDVSSLKRVMHAAAPCPIDIKEKMIAWWGPIIAEFYGSTEGCGYTSISTDEWLLKKGSIGRPVSGIFHILDEAGNEVPPSVPGAIWVEGARTFSYYKDAAKTQSARNNRGWQTIGDFGYLDSDGYVYLTDRAAFMINSGGVKISSQEIENVLHTHPSVAEAAVFGVPDKEFGEQVKAIVQLKNFAERGDDLAAELIAYCQAKLSRINAPKSIEFEEELPRNALGKLMKKDLKARYWPVAGNLSEALA